METLISFISNAGGAKVLTSLYSKLKDELSMKLVKKIRCSIPYAYYHDMDLKTYVWLLQENKETDSIVTPDFLHMVYKFASSWIDTFSDLACREDHPRQIEIANAFWACYCGINIFIAKKYLEKIPKDHSLNYVFYAVEAVRKHQKEHIDQFWPMMVDHIPAQSTIAREIKKHLMEHYYEEGMIDELLAEYNDCLKFNIPLYRITLKSIGDLCTKMNRPIPENVKHFLDPNLYVKKTSSVQRENQGYIDKKTDSNVPAGSQSVPKG